jgi:D-alanyl-D-alanine carboxypeptidase
MLVLVNDSHPLSVLTPPELVTLSNGNTVDARMYPALQALFDAMRAKGLSPFVREGFRTNEMQQDILDTRIRTYVNQGYSKEKARSLALQYVAEPGTSEHQLGLAVDINSTDGNSWPCYNWLAAHAQEYGFILRYPQGKEKITGISYEPWHYRYVGEKAAAEIYAAGVTLEEYLGE